VFHLKEAWGTFPFLLADNTGLIVNTRVLEAMGKEAFGMKPTGAGVGPYEVESFTPNEKLVLKAKDDYWGGPVCIETITVTDIPLEQATFDALELGEIDVFFGQDPRVLADAEDEGYGTHVELDHTGAFVMINSGLRGSTPDTRDPRLRRAVAHAIDAEAMAQRIWGDDGSPNTAIISEGPLKPDVEGPQFDQAEARRLVEEAKADGWDGSLSLVCSSTNPDVPVAIEGFLEAVGIDVQAELLQTGALVQRVNIEGNYEITCSSMVTFDSSPFVGMNRWFGPGNSFTGFTDPAFDASLRELKAAQTVEDQRDALAELQEIWNEVVPSAVYAAVPWAQIWGERVHGLTFNLQGGMYFTEAWVDN
jgi:peptide/nickel transport system substrate-binding protein